MGATPAAGGGRWVDVPPARLRRWVDAFAQRHGGIAEEVGLVLRGADGARAVLHPPAGVAAVGSMTALAAAVAASRTLGLVLARRGAVAVALAEGDTLTRTKVDTRYVQGRTAAGGWSQRRFARRRDNQTKAAAVAGADLAARLLLPEADRLTALVCGGDRRMIDMVMSDRRLAPLVPLRAPRLLDVPEPRYAVLETALAAARAVRVQVTDPGPAAPPVAGTARP